MMRITELLKQESIGLNVSVSTKEEAIDKLVDLMAAGGRLKDKAGYKEGILAREALGSTGIGGGRCGGRDGIGCHIECFACPDGNAERRDEGGQHHRADQIEPAVEERRPAFEQTE